MTKWRNSATGGSATAANVAGQIASNDLVVTGGTQADNGNVHVIAP